MCVSVGLLVSPRIATFARCSLLALALPHPALPPATALPPSARAPRPPAAAGNIELIRRLVQQFNCDLLVKSMNSWTPLHYAAAYNQVGNTMLSLSLLHQVVTKTHQVVHRTAHHIGFTVSLFRCTSHPQVAAIEALVGLGCEVAVQDAVGSTPIHVAAGEGHCEAVQELVRLGCSSQGGSVRGVCRVVGGRCVWWCTAAGSERWCFSGGLAL